MKNLQLRMFFALAALLPALSAFGQEPGTSSNSTSSTTTTTTSSGVALPEVSEGWLQNPWVWVIGGIVLVVLLALIFGGKSRSNAVTQRTTITRTDEEVVD